MTMVPSPKLSKPLHFFYGGCGGGGGASGVMTRFSDGCSADSGGYVSVYNNNIITSNGVAANNLNQIDNNNFPCHNNIVMSEEQHSRNSNTSVNDDDGDQLLPVAAAAASSASMNGRDKTPTPPPPPPDHRHHHHQGSSSNWLQLGLGGTTQSSFEHQHPITRAYESTAQVMQMGGGGGGGGGGGLMLELNLGGDGGRSGMIHQTTPESESGFPPQRPLDFGSPSFFGGVGSSATVFLSPSHHHHSIFPLVPPNPNPNSYPHPHPQPVLLSEDHQTGWGFRNQTAVAGCSSSLSPSSSSSMPPAVHGQGSFLTRPFTPSGSSVDSEFRLIHPPPRRPHSGIWFTLQASLNQ